MRKSQSTVAGREAAFARLDEIMQSVPAMTDAEIATHVQAQMVYAFLSDGKSREYMICLLARLLAKRIVGA